jgi:conjugal transfer mating pair stabilization protein TraN
LGTWAWWFIYYRYYAYFDQACTFTGVELTLNDTRYSWKPLDLAPGSSTTLVSEGLTGTYTNSSSPTYYCPPGEILSGATCLASSAPGCADGQLDSSLDVCFAPSVPSPVCSAGTYDPGSGKCIEDTYTCPLGDYACLDTGAEVPQCSPDTCFDLGVPGNDLTELPPEDPMLQNDGEVDEEGNCLGELYIFSGKASRCRPPGITVGTANDCCDSDEPALTDSTTGPRINQVVTAVQTVYEVAQVGYYAYSISTGAMAAVEVGGQVVVYNMASGTIAASYASGSAVGTGVVAAQGAAAGGAAATGTVSSALTSYMGALFNPTTIAIAIVVMVVMKVLMGSGCDQRDIEAAMLEDSGYCHYVGTTCERKWSMVGCVQKAKRFCCFNSKLARIIHEQGRPQLASFGPSGDWGTPKEPNCRGFTPEEFQMLDFARIDLSAYYGDIQKDLTQKIQDAQIDVQQRVQQHYEAIR